MTSGVFDRGRFDVAHWPPGMSREMRETVKARMPERNAWPTMWHAFCAAADVDASIRKCWGDPAKADAEFMDMIRSLPADEGWQVEVCVYGRGDGERGELMSLRLGRWVGSWAADY
jgi:hypothetical protein